MYSWKDISGTSAVRGGTFIQGDLNSAPNTTYKIQFFANMNLDNREGKRFLSELFVTTDLAGGTEILANFKDVMVVTGEVVTATATKLDADSMILSTSEFSEPVELNTDEGNHYIANTTLAGIPLHWKDGKGDYNLSPSIPNQDYGQAIINGFNTWSESSRTII